MMRIPATPTRGGWIPIMILQPASGLLLRFKNEYSAEEWTGYAQDLPAEQNGTCIWWKLTGIARNILEGEENCP